MTKAETFDTSVGCAYSRGDRVEITEEGIRPWRGTVTTCKPSFMSGWWLDVQRDDDGMMWSICASNVGIRLIPNLKLVEEES